MTELQGKFEKLREILRPLPSVLVAFSGGVDSTFLLETAVRELTHRVVALTTLSPTMPAHDREQAFAIARRLGVRHLVVESNELEISGYAHNPLNRCYLCKTNLFSICSQKARELGIEVIVDGLNLDDLNDYRPGIKAAAELKVRHPLVEAQLTKSEIRELSRQFGLPTWDKPASPCLSSRFPYGTEITLERLEKVEKGEALLRALGFAEVRVRYHGEIARIELDRRAMSRAAQPEIAALIVREFERLGFRFVTLDLAGFRSGSLNQLRPIASAQ